MSAAEAWVLLCYAVIVAGGVVNAALIAIAYPQRKRL